MCILATPFVENSKIIVIDEASEALYARSLIRGLLQRWKVNSQNVSFELLSFSNPKSWYSNGPLPSGIKNLNIHDFYALDIDSPVINDHEKLDKFIENAKSDSMASQKFDKKSVVIVDDLSSLIVFAGLAKALWFIAKLSSIVPKMICIYHRNFAQQRIPCIETLGTAYIRLEKYNGTWTDYDLSYCANVTVHKSGTTVFKESTIIRQDTDTYRTEIVKASTRANMKNQSIGTKDTDKVEASFRIDMSEREMQQKINTPLPYVVNHNTSKNTSKIIYQPEDVDDLDEEDPDDDLCI